MKPFKKFIKEAIITDQPFYHGGSIKIEKFDEKFAGKGVDQDGPGFYFSSNYEDAKTYTPTGGWIHEVLLSFRKMLSDSKKANIKEAEKLLRMAPNLKDSLTDWGENYNEAIDFAIKTVIDRNNSQKEVFEQIWYDFYHRQRRSDLYLKNVVKLGYDGILLKKGHIIHAIMYNPDKIKIISVSKIK